VASVVELLNDIDLTKLTASLNAARQTVSVDGSASLRSLDPRDLLGDLGQILKSPEAFGIEPAQIAKSVAEGLGGLDVVVQLPSIPVLGEVSEGIEGIVSRLQDGLTNLGLGSGEIDLDALLPELGGFDTVIESIIRQVLDAINPQVAQNVTALLSGLKGLAAGDPPNGQELARTLSSVLFGLDLDALTAPASHLRDLLDGIASAGGDLGPVEREVRRLTAELRQATEDLQAPAIDVAGIQARLTRLRGDFGLLVHNTIPGAAVRVSADLDALNVDRLAADVQARLRPLLEIGQLLSFDFERELLVPFRALATQVEALTPDRLGESFRSLEAEFDDVANNLGIEPALESVDELFDSFIDLIEDVPVRRLRDDLFDALNAIEARIRTFEGFQAPDAIGSRARDLAAKLDALDASALQPRIAEFSRKIQDAIDAFPIGDVVHEIERVSEAVAAAIAEFVPALQDLAKQVDDFAGQLEAIDFSQAGEASVSLIADIRDKVQSVVGSDDVPDAARAAIGVAAAGLKKVEFTVAISAPFDDVMASVDVSAVTAPLEGVTKRVRQTLETVTPKAIIDQLEQPYEQLLGDLQRLRPQALVAGLSQEFQRLMAQVEELRPETLVAPLDTEFKKITGALRAAIDPAPLFQPLRALYQKLQELVDLLDMEKVFGKIHERIVGLPTTVGERVHGTLTQRFGSGANLDTDAAGDAFEWGDFLRPFAILVGQVRVRVQRLAESLLREGLEILQAPLRLLARFTDGASDLLSEVAGAIAQRYRALDLFAEGGAAEELLVSLNGFEAAAASASISGEAKADIGGQIAAMRVDVGAHASADTAAQRRTHQTRFGLAVGRPDLSDALRRSAVQIHDVVPETLLIGDQAVALSQRIAGLFDALDFAAAADELDSIGARVRAKLQEFLTQIMNAMLRIWTRLIEAALPVTPRGMLARVTAGMKKVRAEFTVLDPAPIEQEVRDIIDAVIDGVEQFSPASLAAQLNGLFDPLKQKLQQLDPAALLGDLNPIATVIDQFEALRPSKVLAPLATSTDTLTHSLDSVLAIKFGAALEAAVGKLRAELDAIVADIEKEFDDLLSFLESQAGGSLSVSVSA